MKKKSDTKLDSYNKICKKYIKQFKDLHKEYKSLGNKFEKLSKNCDFLEDKYYDYVQKILKRYSKQQICESVFHNMSILNDIYTMSDLINNVDKEFKTIIQDEKEKA